MSTSIIRHDPDALLQQWGQLAYYLKTGGSELALWLATRRMKRIWLAIHPQTKQGGAPKPKAKGSQNEIFSPGLDPAVSFVKQFITDTGKGSAATISRWVHYADALTLLLGESKLEHLVAMGSRLANNPKGMLVKVSKLTSPEQAEDVVRIYQEGAGQTAATKAVETYLAVQAEREKGASTDEDDNKEDRDPNDLRVPFTCPVGEQAEVVLDGRPVTITIVAADDGRSTGTLSVEVSTASRGLAAPTTRTTWVSDIARALQDLPHIVINPVEILLPRFCAKCKGSFFYDGGDCVRCRPSIAQNSDGVLVEQALPLEEARPPYTPYFLEQMRVVTHLFVSDRKRQLIEANPRLGRPYGWQQRNYRNPRTRVRITTPKGDCHVVLWERETDVAPYASGLSPCLTVGSGAVRVSLNRTEWFHCRGAFRRLVLEMTKYEYSVHSPSLSGVPGIPTSTAPASPP